MQSISTKTGDDGRTSLANGERVAKDSLVIELIGVLDELNSWLGLVVARLPKKIQDHRHELRALQQDIYQLSAVLAQAPKVEFKEKKLERVESAALALEERLEANWHQKFLYPGGTELSAQLDLARTVCRRAERLAVKYDREVELEPLILRYLNRLSDYLYLLRCFFNQVLRHPEEELAEVN